MTEKHNTWHVKSVGTEYINICWTLLDKMHCADRWAAMIPQQTDTFYDDSWLRNLFFSFLWRYLTNLGGEKNKTLIAITSLRHGKQLQYPDAGRRVQTLAFCCRSLPHMCGWSPSAPFRVLWESGHTGLRCALEAFRVQSHLQLDHSQQMVKQGLNSLWSPWSLPSLRSMLFPTGNR